MNLLRENIKKPNRFKKIIKSLKLRYPLTIVQRLNGKTCVNK